MGITKQAGRFTVMISTDGWPRWSRIACAPDGAGVVDAFSGLVVDDLKDLRYCLDEAIAKDEKLKDQA